MAILFGPDSAYAAERRKWEAGYTEFGPGERPWSYQEYPVMLSKASRPPQGGPPTFDDRIAADANEERNWQSRGYVRGHDKALEALDAETLHAAQLAAEREFEKQHRLSAKARAEVERVEVAAGAQHLPVIPETPIKRRGRPRKAG